MRVQHPAFPEIFTEITEDRLADHLAAGWLECPDEIDGQRPPADETDAEQVESGNK